MLQRSKIISLLCFLAIVGLLDGCQKQEALSEPTATPVSILSSPAPILPPQPVGPLPTTRPRRLSAGELQLAADIDDIPAIFAEDDLFVGFEAGSQEWVDKELVVGVEINGDARAYPIRLLSNHEIVNDLIGGEPVAITWCPLCFTAVVFDRLVDGQELTFGVSGYLYYNNLVMYDHRTNTLWSQIAGEAIRGAFRGEQLGVRPSIITSWGEWKAAYPETRILSAAALGTSAADVFDPYSGYYTTGFPGVTGWANPDNRLPAKELVVGLIIGQEARAYPLALIREVGLVQDELGGVPLLLVFDPGLGSVIVYRRETAALETAGVALNFSLGAHEGRMRDEETGTLWDIRNGRALEGALASNDLSRLAAPLVYWFAWSDIHNQTDIYPTSPE